jgi:hypothetical protein
MRMWESTIDRKNDARRAKRKNDEKSNIPLATDSTDSKRREESNAIFR